jgi:hypothetical protein
MGLFNRSEEELEALQQRKFERKHPYAAELKRKQSQGIELTPDEKRTLAAFDSSETAPTETQSTDTQSAYDSSQPHCPICGSTNIQFLGNKRKSFSVGKAVGGAVLTGGIGVLAGFAGKKGKDQWLCMDHGHRFTL